MRKTLASLAVALVGAAFVALPQDASAQDKPATVHPDPLAPLQKAMKEQDSLAAEGKADKAIAYAEKQAEDGTAESLYLLGRALGNKAYFRAEQQRQERAEATKVRAGDPPPPFVLDDESKRLLDRARDAFERSSEAGGLVYAPAFLGIGRIALLKGEVDPAIEALKQAVRIAPNFREAAIELTASYSSKHLDAEAEFTLHQFLTERPTDVDARILLGMLLRDRRRFEEAEAEFRAALATEPKNVEARRQLAAVLLFQEHLDEAAAQFESVRAADPKDEQAYVYLFQIYVASKKKDEAAAVLRDILAVLPGTKAAQLAKTELQRVKDDPTAWDDPNENPQETLARRLESKDPAVREKALTDMRAYKWKALPGRVYQSILNDKTPGERLAAVRLIGDLGAPYTLVILEILLLHPTDQEPEPIIRREVARAISLLPTDAIVPILFAALSDADAEIREYAVQGIYARTGKSFRLELNKRTSDAEWPEEMKRYAAWWNSSSSSSVKRGAAIALLSVYEPATHDSKARIGLYALPAMDDAVEESWRAGYDLFRAMTFHSFGAESGPVTADERKRITAEAKAWLAEQLAPKKPEPKKADEPSGGK